MLENGSKRILNQTARGHGKTWFFAKAYPLWLTYRANSPINICLISFAQAQSTRLVTDIKHELERNPHLQFLKPSLTDTWGKTQLMTNYASIVSESFGSSVRGGHFDFLIVDDAVKDYAGMSREDQIDFFSGVLLPTLNPNGTIVVVGTPVDKQDLIHHLEKNPAYVVRKYPAIINNQPLWPERYSLEMLNQMKTEMGSTKFSREFLLEVIDEETALFKENWIKTTTQIPDGLKIYVGIDLAIGQRPDSDYFAEVVVGVDNAKNLFVLKAMHGRYTLQQQIDLIKAVNDEYHPVKIVIEGNAFQSALPDHLACTTGMPIKKVISQQDKVVRAERLSVHFENQKILIREGLTDLIDELVYFPRARHDDLIDALGFATEEAMRPRGMVKVKIL